MASKKEIIQWVTIQINKKMKSLPKKDFDASDNIKKTVEKHIKDPIYRYIIIKAMYVNSRYDEELKMWIPSITHRIEKLCVEAGIYDSVINILNEVDDMYANYKAETDNINIHNNKLKDLLVSFKEGMLLISNEDLADYARAFIDSIGK